MSLPVFDKTSAPSEGVPSALFSLCHWRLLQNQVVFDDPAQLQLSEHEAQALFETLAPFFAEVALTLHMQSTNRWYIQGQALHGITLMPLHSAIGQDLRELIAQQKTLQGLQSEVQMLLYQHPVNDARITAGLPTINAFWLYQDTTAHKPKLGWIQKHWHSLWSKSGRRQGK